MEKATQKFREKVFIKTHFKKDEVFSGLVSGLITFSIVAFAWIFFRANSFADAKYIILSMFSFQSGHSLYELGLSEFNVNLSIILIVILLLLEYLNKFVNLKVYLNNRNVILRWGFYFILLFTILLYGVYGGDSPEFLYFQF